MTGQVDYLYINGCPTPMTPQKSTVSKDGIVQKGVFCVGQGHRPSLTIASNGIYVMVLHCRNPFLTSPLILVLMEYALWQNSHMYVPKTGKGLNPCSNGICSLTRNPAYCRQKNAPVLILVLMEYALWLERMKTLPPPPKCLNPCSNGICSLTWRTVGVFDTSKWGLNPCSNGICSLTGTM